MKSVGEQLQEARLAKNWTPELAARETKIKAERIRDLESDDYAHFSSPAYARGFVRTYARALGLDEYKILRLLDNKLPEDDNASFAQDAGLPYVPEPSQTMHVSSAPRTGLYVVFGLFCAVVLVISFVLFQAYRAGELPRYFASTASPDSTISSGATNSAPAQDADAPAHALPVDPNDTGHSVRALPVDTTAAAPDTNAAPASPAAATDAPTVAAAPVAPVASEDSIPVAKPATEADVAAATPSSPPAVVDTAASTNSAPAPDTAPATTDTPPVAMALNNSVPPLSAPTPTDTTASSTPPPANPPVTFVQSASAGTEPIVPTPATQPAPATTAPVPPVTAPAPEAAPAATTESSKAPAATEKVLPRALPVSASELAADEASAQPPAAAPGDGSTMLDLGPGASATSSAKRLVLTASHDSFVRVTALHGGEGSEVLYASVLRQGQSLSFSGHRFSVNVGVPSAVDIILDGVNYGPHSDGNSPETFTLESHQP